MTALVAKLRLHPLYQLVLLRLFYLTRETNTIISIVVFPLIITTILGLAFHRTEAAPLPVAIVEGAGAEALAQKLAGSGELGVQRVSADAASDGLRSGQFAVVVVAGEVPEFLFDPARESSRAARILVVDALERAAGRKDVAEVKLREVVEPGSRYIDFVLPGLIGYGAMNASLMGIGFAIVMMRMGRVLKRMMATPMKKSHFLLSFLIARSMLAVWEVGYLVAFGWIAFSVPVVGNLGTLFAVGIIGALSFGGLALLIAARPDNPQSMLGWTNLVALAMMMMSGVFFSTSHFPEWLRPAISVLPLTALVDGLRGVMTEGLGFADLWRELLVMIGWGAGSFALALRLFRWT